MPDDTAPWWSVPVRAWLASRLLVLVAALAAVPVLGVPTRGVDPSVPKALAYLGAWDTTWYLDIARNGYAFDGPAVGTEFTNLAFFPLLPLVMAAARSVGANPFLVTVLLGHLACNAVTGALVQADGQFGVFAVKILDQVRQHVAGLGVRRRHHQFSPGCAGHLLRQ